MLQTTYTYHQYQLNSALRYNSKTFNIEPEWDGGSAYTLTVSDARTGKLIEVLEEKRADMNKAQHMFNRLKTKYIFDYDNVLSASRSENAGAYHFSREKVFKPQVDCRQ